MSSDYRNRSRESILAGLGDARYLRAVASFQELVSDVYAAARDEAEPLLAEIVIGQQRNAAEMHHHLRWLLGLEESCPECERIAEEGGW